MVLMAELVTTVLTATTVCNLRIKNTPFKIAVNQIAVKWHHIRGENAGDGELIDFMKQQ